MHDSQRNLSVKSVLVRRGVVSDAPALAEFAARTFADTFGTDNRPEDLQVQSLGWVLPLFTSAMPYASVMGANFNGIARGPKGPLRAAVVLDTPGSATFRLGLATRMSAFCA